MTNHNGIAAQSSEFTNHLLESSSFESIDQANFSQRSACKKAIEKLAFKFVADLPREVKGNRMGRGMCAAFGMVIGGALTGGLAALPGLAAGAYLYEGCRKLGHKNNARKLQRANDSQENQGPKMNVDQALDQSVTLLQTDQTSSQSRLLNAKTALFEQVLEQAVDMAILRYKTHDGNAHPLRQILNNNPELADAYRQAFRLKAQHVLNYSHMWEKIDQNSAFEAELRVLDESVQSNLGKLMTGLQAQDNPSISSSVIRDSVTRRLQKFGEKTAELVNQLDKSPEVNRFLTRKVPHAV